MMNHVESPVSHRARDVAITTVAVIAFAAIVWLGYLREPIIVPELDNSREEAKESVRSQLVEAGRSDAPIEEEVRIDIRDAVRASSEDQTTGEGAKSDVRTQMRLQTDTRQ